MCGKHPCLPCLPHFLRETRMSAPAIFTLYPQRFSYGNYMRQQARIKWAEFRRTTHPPGVLPITPTIGDNPEHEQQMVVRGDCVGAAGRLLVAGRADDEAGG